MVGLVPQHELVDDGQRSGGNGDGRGAARAAAQHAVEQPLILRRRHRGKHARKRLPAAAVATRDRDGEVGEGCRIDVRARPRPWLVGRRPVRRPEADVDHHLQTALLCEARRLVERQPARLLVGGRVARVEIRRRALSVGVAGQQRPVRRDPDAVDAQRAQLLHRAADLLAGPVQQQRVVLHERLERSRRRCDRHEHHAREDQRCEQAMAHPPQCVEARLTRVARARPRAPPCRSAGPGRRDVAGGRRASTP